jgi:predicted alpha/beta-fold hydrolase
MSCLGDIPLRSKLTEAQSQFAGKDGKAKAATVISSYWKMKSVKDKYDTLRKSTIVIQRFFRKKLLRLALEKKLEEKNKKIVDNF